MSGAFDRVRCQRLLAKLRAKGVRERWVELFASWLRERPAKVVVGGRCSDELLLRDMVFQGTVWGPLLWNVFYEDAVKPVRDSNFTEVMYADDLNAFAEVPATTSNTEALAAARTCQTALHLGASQPSHLRQWKGKLPCFQPDRTRGRQL